MNGSLPDLSKLSLARWLGVAVTLLLFIGLSAAIKSSSDDSELNRVMRMSVACSITFKQWHELLNGLERSGQLSEWQIKRLRTEYGQTFNELSGPNWRARRLQPPITFSEKEKTAYCRVIRPLLEEKQRMLERIDSLYLTEIEREFGGEALFPRPAKIR